MDTPTIEPPETSKTTSLRLDIYLKTAAKLVETVAFEMAEDVPAVQVESLLSLVCGIEAAAAKLAAKP